MIVVETGHYKKLHDGRSVPTEPSAINQFDIAHTETKFYNIYYILTEEFYKLQSIQNANYLVGSTSNCPDSTIEASGLSLIVSGRSTLPRRRADSQLAKISSFA